MESRVITDRVVLANRPDIITRKEYLVLDSCSSTIKWEYNTKEDADNRKKFSECGI
jgi:hypothetical protein